MDTDYIINRLKSTPYKFTTVAFLKARINNMEEHRKQEVLLSLRKQLDKESNLDIQESIFELVYRLPIAS